MTLEELIGQRLVLGFHGCEATDELVVRLAALHASNLIVFEHNIESPEQLTRLLRRLEEALGRRLWVMVDHEGGRVVRFRHGMTRFPDAMTVSKTQRIQDVERQGAVEAEELKRLGIGANLAPCVDVRVPGSNPVIGDRSYGPDPSRVGALAVARIRGLQSGGVAACAKHFPGLGAVRRDPHKDLTTISLDRTAMERHLAPFHAAVEAGVAMVMSSHVCYPALEGQPGLLAPATGRQPGLPATFSESIIRGLLRWQLRFSGLILTDDMEMGALRTFGDMGELAVRATQAGHDLLLIGSDLAAARQAAEALRRAYKGMRLSREELEASVECVRRARQQFFA